jgi:hypothetical protein
MKNNIRVQKSSLGMFDLLKGIVMILVVVSHTEGLIEIPSDYTINDIIANINPFIFILILIYKFLGEAAMPALFIISGYGFRKTTNKKNIVKQIKGLLTPYFISMLIATIIHLFSYYILYSWFEASIKQTVSIFLGGLLALPTDRYVNDFRLIACGPIWFLVALAIASIIFNILANHFEGKKLLASSLFVACIGWVCSLAGPLPWCISQSLIAVFYLGLGYYVKKNKLFFSPLPIYQRLILWTLVVLYIICISSSHFFAMALDLYPYGPIGIIGVGLFALVVIWFFLQLNGFNGFICTFLRKIGRLSLYVLCVHSIEMVAVGSYVQYLFVHEWWNGSSVLRSSIILAIRIPIAVFGAFAYVRIKEGIIKTRKAYN